MVKTFKINMTLDMVQAMNDLLVGINPQGRSAMRKHKAIMSAMRVGCCIEKTTTDEKTGAEGVNRYIKRGTIEVELEPLEYFADELDKKIVAGVPGQLSVGYGELLEAIEAVPELKKEEAK